jgi:hypothetical protein
MSMDQLELFPDIALMPTPAMLAGTSHLFQCRMCGSLLCVPSSSTRSNLAKQVQRELTVCPRCAAHDWHPVDYNVGPFHWRTP